MNDLQMRNQATASTVPVSTAGQPARLFGAVGLAFLAVLGVPAGAVLFATPATAQYVVALVSGEPITALDVTQRTRLLQMIGRGQPSRKEIVDELITEKLKLQEARRLGITVSDSEVDRTFASLAQQSGRSAAQFTEVFKQAQIDVRNFKTRLRADLAWRQVLQRSNPGAFQVREADVVAALAARGERPSATALQYTLRQVVFVVPRGSPDSVRAARAREAETLRTRFSNCERDIHLAREFREVVVKDPVIRISTDLPTRLQELLAKTPDGRMTPPEPTGAGIEVVAVCSRKETVADLSSRREIRDELLNQRVEVQEKQLLDRLRRQAIIEYR